MAVQPYQAGTNGGTGVLSSTSGYGAKYGELSAADAFTIQKKFLAISKQLITMARFAQKDTKPLNEGRDIRFRRYERFAVNTTEISEGVTPTSDSLQQTTIKATLAQYGAWVPVTDVMLALSTDPIVAQITERQAIQMAEQMDTLAYNKFKATSSVFYADASDFDGGFSEVQAALGGNIVYKAPGESGTDAKILSAVVRFLEKNNAPKISQVIKPTSGYNTEPVAEGYFAITHPDARADIEAMPGFTPIEKYASYGAVMAGEIGKVGLIRFIATTLATPYEQSEQTGHAQPSGGALRQNADTNVKVYTTLVFSQDAVGCVSLSGQDSVVPKVISPTPSSEDPLGQRGAVGYSYHYTCLVLNDNNMARIHHGVTNVGG
tara:strand:- start:529 stop:1659 length:1131 start_codon:yes stop_codon:yes gene_type:complete